MPEFRRDTLALFGSFFFCLLSVYMGTNWVPSMLTGAGFDVGTASYGLTAFNFGGVVGAIVGALVIMRLGSRITMLTMAAGAVAGAVVMAVMPIGPQDTVLVFACSRGPAGSSTPCRRRCTRWRRTCIRQRFARPASARPSPSAGSAAYSARRSELGARYRGRLVPFFPFIAVTMAVTFVALASVRRQHTQCANSARGGADAAARCGIKERERERERE